MASFSRILAVAIGSLIIVASGSSAYAWDPVRDVTGRTLKQHAKRAIKRTGNSLEKFAHNPLEYALEMPLTLIQEVCAVPTNVLRYNYQSQVQNWQRLPQALIADIQRFYKPVDLSSVRFAENVRTINASAVTMGNLIYFRGTIDFNNDDDLFLVLHELEHTVQYRGEKRSAKLCEYTVKAYTHGFNHDDIGWERAADRKANSVLQALFQQWKQDDDLAPDELYIENTTWVTIPFAVQGADDKWREYEVPPKSWIIVPGEKGSRVSRMKIYDRYGTSYRTISNGAYWQARFNIAQRKMELVAFDEPN